MDTRLVRLTQLTLVWTALVSGVASAQTAPPDAKLDESLRESVQRGCVGTTSVIVRTQPGYRQGLRDTLAQHGDIVRGEFPALDAIAAEVHCEDLKTLAGFGTVSSVSANARVGAQGLLSVLTGSTTTSLEQALTDAKAALASAKTTAAAAQALVQTREAAVRTAQANLAAAQKSLSKATLLTKATAEAGVTLAQSALLSAQQALVAARAQATTAQATVLDRQEDVVQARNALTSTIASAAAREREGQAARGLKRRFFATMPLANDSNLLTDEQIESSSADASSWQNAFNVLVTSGGGSIGVAVIDSGIEPGIDFGSRITAFYDFTQGDVRAVAANDGYGHGTHVAGLIASQYVGMAPDARLVGLKVLNEKGQGATANVVRAIEFAIASKDLLGINVLNLSLGHPIYEPAATDPLVQAVEHASRSGLIVVVSAGNFGISRKTGDSGYAGIVSPGNAPSGITVGATRTFNTVTRVDDRVAPYSSRGPSWYDGFAKPDVVAPGDNLLSVAAANSTLRLAQEARGNTGNYMRLSGTSMSAGVTSGLVALLLEANRALTPNAVKAVLEYTAIPVRDDVGNLYNALTQGAGEIELTGALTFAKSINSSAGLEQSWLSSSISPSTVIGGKTYTWSQSIIWGNHRVAGDALLKENRQAWALNVVWGNLFDDDNIVWGNLFDDDNIVWGNNIVWGILGDDDNIVWGNASLFDDDNIVWGNNIVWGGALLGLLGDDDNIVWGNFDDDNIVWGNLFDDDNIVWGNAFDDDNIVWGNAALLGNVTQWIGGCVVGRSDSARARRVTRKAGVQ